MRNSKMRVRIEVGGLAAACWLVAACAEDERHVWGDSYPSPTGLGGDGGVDVSTSAGSGPASTSSSGSGPPAGSGSDDGADTGFPPHTTGLTGAESTGNSTDETPYQGGWDVGACADEIVATGNQVGGIVEDFSLVDQYGDHVRLYDFCHKAVLLTAGAFW